VTLNATRTVTATFDGSQGREPHGQQGRHRELHRQ
jgi:hypothetical protein